MRITLAFVGCVLIWGTTWYAIEWQLGHVAKAWSLTYRYSIASVILLAWCGYKGLRLSFNKKQHAFMFVTGFLLFSSNYYLVYWGTEYLTSGLVAVTFSLLTFLNIINARLFLKTKISPRSLLASLLGVVGLIFIFKPEIHNFSMNDTTTLGLMLCITATLLASGGNTLVATKTGFSLPLLPFNAWAMSYGALCNLVFALISGEAPSLDPRPQYYLALIYLSVFGTVIAFSWYLWLLTEIGIARSSYMAVMTPLVALAISTLYENYQWTGYAVAGVALVVIGNILMSLSKSKTT